MKRISKPVATVLLILGCVVIFFGFKYFQCYSPAPSKPAVVAKLPQRAKGNPTAKIKIIEFIDFQCPACATGYEILNDYFKKNPDGMYIELRYFPLQMHKHGLTSARWGECSARQGKFWPFLDLLLKRQKEWSDLTDPLPPFRAMAQEAGLDVEQIKVCLQYPGLEKPIQSDVEEGKMRQVVSTPSYLINHEMIVGTKSLQMKLDGLLGIKTTAP